MDAFLADFLTPAQFLMCFGIVCIASALQISVGMGFGMLSAPLIALINPGLVPASILIMGMFVAFAGAWKERGNIAVSELGLGISGRVVGSLCALGLLIWIPDRDSFLILFGILILVAVLLTVSGLKTQFNSGNLFGLSVISGLMGTITAVGAPPMAIIYHDRPPKIVRPTLNAFFGAGSVLAIIGLVATGWMTFAHLLAATLFMPAIFCGAILARTLRKLPSIWLSRTMLTLSALAAISLIVKGVT